MRVGIFGGTFNPPHLGHSEALRAFCECAGLDKVIIIPTFIPPHKDKPSKWADFEKRLHMCRLAFSDVSECEIEFSEIEKKLFEKTGEKSYTYLTLEALKENSCDTFCLYMGTDMFVTLGNWKKPQYLLENAEIWVMPRDFGEYNVINNYKDELLKSFNALKIDVIEKDFFKASSTAVRDGDLSLLQNDVRDYIEKEGLYK